MTDFPITLKQIPEFRGLHNRKLKIGVCTLNQWAMDFEGNKQRILDSIKKCAEENCSIRVGPELEISGYSCEDHFLEGDTVLHSWEIIRDIIEFDVKDMLLDVGSIVEWHGTIYNCRVFIYNKKILMIRPKSSLADDGNYREGRWFTAWKQGYKLFDFKLPTFIKEVTNQSSTKIGMGILNFNDCSIASELCEELWDCKNPSTDFSLNGAEIIINSSGSHFSINKYSSRINLVKSNSRRSGGCYIYCNVSGCDGGRLYFDGGSFAYLNGTMISEGQSFSVLENTYIFPVIDLEEISKYRTSMRSRCISSTTSISIDTVNVDDELCKKIFSSHINLKALEPTYLSENNQIELSTACYLWDYLRRSKASGFFLPLSGGADSSSVAIIVSNMCRLLYKESLKNDLLLKEIQNVVKDKDFIPSSPRDICKKIFFTAYLGMKFSSAETRKSASNVAAEINSNHYEVDIDSIYNQFISTINDSLGFKPKFRSEGGSWTEDLSLQNLQSRIRMVTSYLLSQITLILPENNKKPGFLLMLSSGNLDESILGYLTKYDCSSGDINPIGSLSKIKIMSFLNYCYKELNYKSLEIVLKLEPSAELQPSDEKTKQTDEADMGFTYEELEKMNELRKNNLCGPYSMFKFLCQIWTEKSHEEIKKKVEKYFYKYSINRHKVTTLTPSIYLDSSCNDDNRYDLRQFLYNSEWTYQFNNIENVLKNK